ncbi:hypothetical protein HDE_12076 [Halotydeus destructor]|nr:hypothetical protein HDE_12076 [Halotydeus destructor]
MNFLTSPQNTENQGQSSNFLQHFNPDFKPMNSSGMEMFNNNRFSRAISPLQGISNIQATADSSHDFSFQNFGGSEQLSFSGNQFMEDQAKFATPQAPVRFQQPPPDAPTKPANISNEHQSGHPMQIFERPPLSFDHQRLISQSAPKSNMCPQYSTGTPASNQSSSGFAARFQANHSTPTMVAKPTNFNPAPSATVSRNEECLVKSRENHNHADGDALSIVNSKAFRKEGEKHFHQLNVERNKLQVALNEAQKQLTAVVEENLKQRDVYNKSKSENVVLQQRCLELEKSLQDLQDKLMANELIHNTLKDRMNHIEKTIHMVEDMKIFHDRKIGELAAELEEYNKVAEMNEIKLKDALVKIADKVKREKLKKHSGRAQIKKVEAELEALKTKSDADSKKYEDEILSAKNSIGSLETRLKELASEKSDLSSTLKVQEEKVNDISLECESTKQLLKESSDEMIAVKEKFAKKLSEMQAENDSCKAEISVLSESRAQLENANSTLLEQLQLKTLNISSLENEREEQKVQLKEKVEAFVSLQSKETTMMADIHQLNIQMGTLSEQLLEKTNQLDATTAEKNLSFSDNSFMKQELELTTKEVYALKQQGEEYLQTIVNYKKQMEEAQKQMDEKLKKIDELKNELTKLREESENLASNVTKTSEDLAKERTEHKSMKEFYEISETDQLQKISELKMDLRQARSEKEQKDTVIRKLQRELTSVNEDCDEKARLIEELNGRLDKFRNQSVRRQPESVSPNRMVTPMRHVSPIRASKPKKAKLEETSKKSANELYKTAAETKRRPGPARKTKVEPVPVDHSTARKDSQKVSKEFDVYVTKNFIKKTNDQMGYPDVQTYTTRKETTTVSSKKSVKPLKLVTGLDWLEDED